MFRHLREAKNDLKNRCTNSESENSEELDSSSGLSTMKDTRERVHASFIEKKEALKRLVRVHGMMAIHCYIELGAPICNS